MRGVCVHVKNVPDDSRVEAKRNNIEASECSTNFSKRFDSTNGFIYNMRTARYILYGMAYLDLVLGYILTNTHTQIESIPTLHEHSLCANAARV